MSFLDDISQLKERVSALEQKESRRALNEKVDADLAGPKEVRNPLVEIPARAPQTDAEKEDCELIPKGVVMLAMHCWAGCSRGAGAGHNSPRQCLVAAWSTRHKQRQDASAIA